MKNRPFCSTFFEAVLPFFLFLGQKSLKIANSQNKKKAQKPAWLLDFLMAEAVGFEPTSP
jgi:hypothetical protein